MCGSISERPGILVGEPGLFVYRKVGLSEMVVKSSVVTG
jgi:hypothetical protein